MKKHLPLLGIGCVLASLPAYGQMEKFYVKGDLGGALTLDTPLKSFYGESTSGAKVKFDPGVRFGVTAGYQLTDWFAAEAQTGVMVNTIDKITGASRVDSAVFSNVPALLNARFHCPKPMRLDPYFGGGLGMAASGISVDHLDFGGTSIHGSESDVVFAYQAFGGLRYSLNEKMGLSLEYHYFATTEPSWDAKNTSGTMRFGGIETHTLSVAFDYHF